MRGATPFEDGDLRETVKKNNYGMRFGLDLSEEERQGGIIIKVVGATGTKNKFKREIYKILLLEKDGQSFIEKKELITDEREIRLYSRPYIENNPEPKELYA